MKRITAALLALLLGANAVAMLAAGRWWYGAVPGAIETGPFNPHFVLDIGAAYAVTAVGLAWSAIAPRAARGWVYASALFLGLHALIHLLGAMTAAQPLGELARDFAGVFLPALLAAWIAWPTAEAA